MNKAKKAKLYGFLLKHSPQCSVHIYSGDRHCSCGRNEVRDILIRVTEPIFALEQSNEKMCEWCGEFAPDDGVTKIKHDGECPWEFIKGFQDAEKEAEQTD